DHTATCRLAVTAAFARGVPNFRTGKVGMGVPPVRSDMRPYDTTVYHAMPHGLRDGLRRRILPGAFVDISSVRKVKLATLACHESQQGWLQASQGMNSYLRQMDAMDCEVGRMSRKFRYAEGWRRHSH